MRNTPQSVLPLLHVSTMFSSHATHLFATQMHTGTAAIETRVYVSEEQVGDVIAGNLRFNIAQRGAPLLACCAVLLTFVFGCDMTCSWNTRL